MAGAPTVAAEVAQRAIVWRLLVLVSPDFVNKIEVRDSWAKALAVGQYSGSPDDTRDGFIHFSTAAQARTTAAKFFAGRDDLVIAAIITQPLGAALKWEVSRGGDLFPHLYAPLDARHVAWTRPLPLDSAGHHVFPAEMT